MAPGQEGKITLAIEHTEGYAGEVAKSASVTTNDPVYPTFNLVLRAYFKPEPMPGQTINPNAYTAVGKQSGPFNVAPNDRWVTSTITGTPAKTVLYLMNRESAPVRIKQLIAGGTNFTVSFQPIEDGKRYEVAVSTNPALKPGQYSQTVRLVTDSKAAPEVTIQLDATVFPKVFATPAAINIPNLSATLDQDAQNIPMIYVRKVRDGDLKITSISSTLPFVRLNVASQAEGQIYTIQIIVDRSKVTAPGQFRGTITVQTNDADVPKIEIPIQGSFVK